jgi:hypothetical protein
MSSSRPCRLLGDRLSGGPHHHPAEEAARQRVYEGSALTAGSKLEATRHVVRRPRCDSWPLVNRATPVRTNLMARNLLRCSPTPAFAEPGQVMTLHQTRARIPRANVRYIRSTGHLPPAWRNGVLSGPRCRPSSGPAEAVTARTVAAFIPASTAVPQHGNVTTPSAAVSVSITS